MARRTGLPPRRQAAPAAGAFAHTSAAARIVFEPLQLRASAVSSPARHAPDPAAQDPTAPDPAVQDAPLDAPPDTQPDAPKAPQAAPASADRPPPAPNPNGAPAALPAPAGPASRAAPAAPAPPSAPSARRASAPPTAADDDPELLMRLRSALRGRDPSRAAPHVFDITRYGALHDSLAYQTLCREDVYAPVTPPFRSLAVDAAVAAAKACAPLAEHLQRTALAHVGALETQLIVDETLDRAGRAKLRRQLRLLLTPGRPAWENWVRQTRDHELTRFDALVRRWREEPLTTLAEKQWFVPGWYRQLDETGAAAVFFTHLPAAVREYLAIELTDGRPLGYPDRCALLKLPLDEANRRARLLGGKFRFKLN